MPGFILFGEKICRLINGNSGFWEHKLITNLVMKKLAIAACLEVFFGTIPFVAYGVSVSCMMAYEEGGAPAVHSSPECPQWVLSSEPSENSTRNCQFATLQGHREYQEDRIACNLYMKLPFSDKNGHEEVTIGIAAIFDGHGGKEASEMASRKLLDYFFTHVVFTEFERVLPSYKNDDELHSNSKRVNSSQGTSPVIDHGSLPGILEEALLRSIQEIDSEFTQEALEKGYASGSTGIVVLLVNDQFLIANIGDSKALLCSERNHSPPDVGGNPVKELYAEELTRDHHPDREDEKVRIEAAGGFVRSWGVPRVNGILAISRSIGDVYFKRYGVVAEPEVTGWRPFTPENIYLVLASDGIFEVFTPQNVCDLLLDKASKSSSEPTPSSLLADWINHSAFNAGSTDNLSTIVIGLSNNTVHGYGSKRH